MGCNCNRQPQPTGFGHTPRGAIPAATQATPYILTLPSGEEVEFGSKLEALAARLNRGGEIRPKD